MKAKFIQFATVFESWKVCFGFGMTGAGQLEVAKLNMLILRHRMEFNAFQCHPEDWGVMHFNVTQKIGVYEKPIKVGAKKYTDKPLPKLISIII